MRNDPKTVALEYIEAVGRKEFGKLDELLAPDLQFKGPAMSSSRAQDFVSALKRIGTVLVRNEVKKALSTAARCA